VRALVDPATGPDDLARPGHMFPLRYQPGGVLVRAGQTEASVDLAVLAGLYPAAVICEIMDADGTMMRLPALERFAARHDLRIISVAQLIRHRAATEKLVTRTAEARLPTRYGEFTVYTYKSVTEHEPHLALAMGDLRGGGPVLTRVHSECLTGDIFGSRRCDCGEQLDLALQRVAAEGRGVVLYMRQEGRGIGLHNKLKAYQLQDQGLDTVEANERLGFPPDLRHYGVGAQILVDLGLRELRLLTNNPKKVVGLEAGFGLRVVEQVPLIVPENPENARYLEVKRLKLGHMLIAKTPCPDPAKAAASKVIRPKAVTSLP
jgi:3,4-dihydroxy 2-butanone 4-phosphate synthase/GTP cyclohydrolase II